MAKRQKLGEMLIAAGVIDAMQLQAALGHQRQWGVPLGRALLEKRFCTEDQILAALARQTGIPTIGIDFNALDKALVPLIPQKVAEQQRAVPLRLEGARSDVLVVALGGPANLASVDEVRSASGKGRVVPYLAKDSEIDRAIDILYRGIEIPANTPPQPGMTFDPLPPPGLHQDEEQFDFGEDTPAPQMFQSNSVADELEPPRPEVLPATATGRSGAALLDELMGTSSTDILARPAPPTTPPAAPVNPVASVARPPPLPRRPIVNPELPPSAAPSSDAPDRPVIIYGWPAAAAELLKATLAGGGIRSRAVETSEPLATVEDDIIIAPLPLIEAIVAARKAPVPGNVIVAVKTPESDLHRAQRVQAKGYLGTPVDGELLLRAVRRCRKR